MCSDFLFSIIKLQLVIPTPSASRMFGTEWRGTMKCSFFHCHSEDHALAWARNLKDRSLRFLGRLRLPRNEYHQESDAGSAYCLQFPFICTSAHLHIRTSAHLHIRTFALPHILFLSCVIIQII
jgi:hypothetical protein